MPDEQKEKIGARLKAFVRRSGLSQAESGQARGNASVTPWMPELLRRTAAEGAVLLKNEWCCRSPEALNFLSLAECRGIGFTQAMAQAEM